MVSQRDRLQKVLSVLKGKKVIPLWLFSTETAICQRDFLDLSTHISKGKTGGVERLTKAFSQLRWDSLSYILLCFFFLHLDFHNPEEDPRFKDSSPSVSHIPTRLSPSSPQHRIHRNAGRRTDNSEVQLKTICPSVGNNSIVNYRTMSLPDTDRNSRRPPIHWSMPHACRGGKHGPRRGK